MIRKQNFFNALIKGISFILLFGCSTSKEKLTFQKSYESIAVNGKHARALVYAYPFIIAGGMDGTFSVHHIDTMMMPIPIVEEVEGMEDFRDGFFQSKGACLFLNSGKNGLIYAVVRSGERSIVFDTSGVFLDGMDFWNETEGIVFGDPVGKSFFLAKSLDNGRTWSAFTPDYMPDALEGEAGFAASGTGIQTVGDSTVYFVTGAGATARLFCSYDRGFNWVAKNTPMKSGGSYGIYSTYFMNQNEGFIMGGSYQDTTYNKGICQYTEDGGDTWLDRSEGLLGYCSCIQGTPEGDLVVATGRMGTFYTLDRGKKWERLTSESFYTCNVSNSSIVLLGRNGKLVVYNYSIDKK